MAKYRLSSATTLHLKGVNPSINPPVYVEEGTIVGDDTPFDFEGPPNRAMIALDDDARRAIEDMEGGYYTGAPTVKGTSAAPEGGAQPFDPASGKTGESEADKAAAKQKEEDEKKAAEAKKAADAKNTGKTN